MCLLYRTKPRNLRIRVSMYSCLCDTLSKNICIYLFK